MTQKTADIIVAAFDGVAVQFYDVTGIDPSKLEKLEPMLNDREQRTLAAAMNMGFSPVHQLVFAVTAQDSYRTFQLMSLIA